MYYNYMEAFDHLPKRRNLLLFDFGGGGAEAAQQAAQVQANAINQAIQTEQQMYKQAREDLAPWRQAGGTALSQYSSMLGLPGYPSVDPTQTLMATPGYQWGLGQGVQALDRSAAARGMSLSGAQQKGLTQFGQQYGLTQAYQPYMSALSGLSSQGLGASGQTGAFGMQAGGQESALYNALGQAQARGIYDAYNARQAGQSGLGSLLGMGAGLLMAPFTGGTSLIGSGMSALSGLFGGGGGSIGGFNYGSSGLTPMGYPEYYA